VAILTFQIPRCNWDFIVLKTMKYDTNLTTFVTWKIENFRKIEKWTFWSCMEFENFRRSFSKYRNPLIFQRTNEYDSNVTNVCATLKYIIVEVRTTGFTGHLNLRRQRVPLFLLLLALFQFTFMYWWKLLEFTHACRRDTNDINSYTNESSNEF
jgi:hypothetical protein